MLRILTYIWRAWFYVAIAIPIFLLFPFIFLLSQRPGWYPQFFRLARIWAWMVILLSGFVPKAIWLQKPEKDKLYIICPNHTSMIDIMIVLALFPNCFLFIGKKELTKIPLFGYFYRKTNLLVNRQSPRSRKEVFERAARKLDEGIGLCIFPEGGVPREEVMLAPFKPGAFKLAVDKQLPIVPVTFPDNKRHLPFDFGKGSPGVLRAVVHPFLQPQGRGPEEVERLKHDCYATLRAALEVQQELKHVSE